MIVDVQSPSTVSFESPAPVNKIVVIDGRGVPFYYRRFKQGTREFKINFPRPGKYKVPGSYKTVLNGLQIGELPQLPTPERNRQTNKPFRVIKRQLPGTPARIYTNQRVIVYSPELDKFDLSTQLFILFHELGHFYYATEEFADLFAFYWMKKLGYNDSSSIYALTKILKPTERNRKRIHSLFNHIKSCQETK